MSSWWSLVALAPSAESQGLRILMVAVVINNSSPGFRLGDSTFSRLVGVLHGYDVFFCWLGTVERGISRVCFGELELAELELIPEGWKRLEVMILVESFSSERNLYTTVPEDDNQLS